MQSMSQSSPTASDRAPPGTPCVGCGYVVGLLRVDEVCPECATKVSDSLRGDLLSVANPDYVRSLAHGTTLVIVGTVISVSWWVAAPLVVALLPTLGLLTQRGGFVILQSIDLLAALLMLAGWWKLTTPNPATQDPARDIRTRVILRSLLVLIAAITLIGYVGVTVPAFADAGMAGVSGNISINFSTQLPPLLIVALAMRFVHLLARAARFLIGLAYLRSLAYRIPDPLLAKGLGKQMWLFPLLGSVGWAILIGPLLGLFLYLRELWRMREALWRCARTVPERE
jgi:hypothetical protein